jgi:hypothetical protein
MKLKLVIASLSILFFSGCVSITVTPSTIPAISTLKDCEQHGTVTDINLEYVIGVWPQAKVADILVSGECYKERNDTKR